MCPKFFNTISFVLLSLTFANHNGLLLPYDVSKNCTGLRQDFADATSKFSSCAINNSRPITLCEKCVQYYLSVVDSYENMTKLYENGTKCIDQFVNQDRLQIILTMYRGSDDLWTRAKCYECFETKNGKVTPEFSTETIMFNTSYNQLMKCLTDSEENATVFCSNCLEPYLKLNDFYDDISNENERIGVCMDIVDKMNDTRIFWSKNCCQYRIHDESIFLGCTTLILGSIILFYCFTQIYTEKKIPTILQQRRFAESLNQADVQ